MDLKNSFFFPADHRLLRRKEFLSCWDKGKKFHTEHFIVVLMKKEKGPTRLGLTASKKVGGAIQRNRVKRLLREFFRLNYCKFDSHLDISIIAKKGAYDIGFDRVSEELNKLLTG